MGMTRNLYELRAELVTYVEQLYRILHERRKPKQQKGKRMTQLQSLFGKTELDRLQTVLFLFGEAQLENSHEDFCAVLTNEFLGFLKHAGLIDTDIREESSSLNMVRDRLEKISMVCNRGIFGHAGGDTTAEIQNVISWIRRLESGMEIINKNKKP